MTRAPTEGPFSRRVLAWIVGVGASSLGLAVALLVVGGSESADVSSAAADAYSRSALGHRAFVALLQARRVPFLVSRYDSARRAGASGLLVVAEPVIGPSDAARSLRLAQLLDRAPTTLLVLPKWRGAEDLERPGWIRKAEPVPLAEVGAVLSAAHVPARPARQERSGAESCAGLSSPVSLRHAQLLEPTAGGLVSIVSCRGGVLLALLKSRDRRLYVLADPDLLSNHGLAREGNAAAMLEIVALVREGRRALVIDETLHGHEWAPTLWRELLRFPLLPAVVQAGLALLVVVLAGTSRFGAPVDASLALSAGKDVLIDNTAFLMRSAGHSRHTLGRYWDAALAEVARALHAPAAASPAELGEWLASAAHRRGVSSDPRLLAELVARERQLRGGAGPAAVVATARLVNRFREEMLRGGREHSGR
jgi:hypothetical protein